MSFWAWYGVVRGSLEFESWVDLQVSRSDSLSKLKKDKVCLLLYKYQTDCPQ
jgi:hypothetical protein